MNNSSKKDFWFHHIEECTKSGLSQVEYCQDHNIALSYPPIKPQSVCQVASIPSPEGSLAVMPCSPFHIVQKEFSQRENVDICKAQACLLLLSQ